MRSTLITSSGEMPLRLSAMRTRNVASERQKEKSFIANALHGTFAMSHCYARAVLKRRSPAGGDQVLDPLELVRRRLADPFDQGAHVCAAHGAHIDAELLRV